MCSNDPGCPHLGPEAVLSVCQQWLNGKCSANQRDSFICGIPVDVCVECGIILCDNHSKAHNQLHHSLWACVPCSNKFFNPFNNKITAVAFTLRCEKVTELLCNQNELQLPAPSTRIQPSPESLENANSSQAQSLRGSERHFEESVLLRCKQKEIKTLQNDHNEARALFSANIPPGLLDNSGPSRCRSFRDIERHVQGLPNNGSTDYFNSAMQVLMGTYALKFYFEGFWERWFKIQEGDASITIDKVTSDSVLNKAFWDFSTAYTSGNRYQTQTRLKQLTDLVGQKIHMSMYQQQDSHELIRRLFDELRAEESRVVQRSFMNYYTLKIGGEQANMVGEFHRLKDHLSFNYLDALFGGKLKQCLQCCRCGEIETRDENFMDLSLSLTNDRQNETPQLSREESSSSVSEPVYKELETTLYKNEHNMYGLSFTRREATSLCFSISEGSVAFLYGLRNGDRLIAINGVNVFERSYAMKLLRKFREQVTLRIGRWKRVDTRLGESSRQTQNRGSNAHSAPSSDLAKLPKRLVDPGNVNIGDRPRKLEELLALFFSVEHLDGDSSYECARCFDPDRKDKQKYRPHPSWKQGLIREPPAVLMLHLKRFKQTKNRWNYNGDDSVSKISDHVSFNPEIDIGPYCTDDVKRVRVGNSALLYSLYAVISHSGSLNGGHYVAYVKKTKGNKEHDKLASVFFQLGMANSSDASEQQRLADDIQGVESKGDGDQWYYISDSCVRQVSETAVRACEAYVLFYERFC